MQRRHADFVRIDAIAQSVNQFVRASYRMDHNRFGPAVVGHGNKARRRPIETISRRLWSDLHHGQLL
jgi:hypothetical protein